MEIIFILAVVAVGAWAARWAYSVIGNRWEFLEKPEAKPLKIILSIIIGYFVGGFIVIGKIIKVGLRLLESFQS